jgi:hypothetical protein
MHYVRGLVMHHMATVCHVLGEREKQAAAYASEQKDMQLMVKALPQHPLGYSLFARCAMNAQQMGAAAAFLSRGLDVAEAVGHDGARAVMSFQRAAALLLGGGGSSFDAAEVQRLLADGEAARQAVLSWWPPAWAAHAPDGDPDRSLVTQRLLPEWERRVGGGAPLPADGEAVALAGLLYVTKAPSAIPPGALVQLEAGGGEGLAAVGEEDA